jgi:hypothetical protein
MDDTNLITEAGLFGLAPELKSITDKLQAHIGQQYSTVHRLWTQTGIKTQDSAGHVTGHDAIRVFVSGSSYLLPADTRYNGPAILPRVRLTKFNNHSLDLIIWCGESEVSLDQSLQVLYEFSDFEKGTSQFVLGALVVAGTPPITFKWQYSTDGQAWHDFVLNQAATSALGYFTIIPGTGTCSYYGWPINGALGSHSPNEVAVQGTLNSIPALVTIAFAPHRAYSGADHTESQAWFFRLLLDNTAIGGGQGIGGPITMWYRDNDLDSGGFLGLF